MENLASENLSPNTCSLCLTSIEGIQAYDSISIVNTLWSEVKFILGEWSSYVHDINFCSKCIGIMVSTLKRKTEMLELISTSYSVGHLKKYLKSLTSISSSVNNESLNEFKTFNDFYSSTEKRIEFSRNTNSPNRNVPEDDLDCNNLDTIDSLKISNFSKSEDCDETFPLMKSSSEPESIQGKYSVGDPEDFVAGERMNIELKIETKILQCGICSFHTKSRSELQKHSNKEHKIGNRYVCKTCGNTFKRKYSCIFHQSIHSDIRPFTCKYCGRGFNWRTLLKKHETLHTGEKPYKCDMCGLEFRLSEQLHKHKKSHRTGEPDKIITEIKNVCEKCGKLYSSHEALYRHLKTHNRKHQCPLCDFSTDDDEEYSKHQIRHSKARRYHCLICHKSFIRREHLTRHLRIHTGETPYRCSFCDKGFAQSQDVKKHERTHTGEKPYCCNDCNRSFATKISLKKHKCLNAEISNKTSFCKKNVLESTGQYSQEPSDSTPTASEVIKLNEYTSVSIEERNIFPQTSKLTINNLSHVFVERQSKFIEANESEAMGKSFSQLIEGFSETDKTLMTIPGQASSLAIIPADRASSILRNKHICSESIASLQFNTADTVNSNPSISILPTVCSTMHSAPTEIFLNSKKC